MKDSLIDEMEPAYGQDAVKDMWGKAYKEADLRHNNKDSSLSGKCKTSDALIRDYNFVTLLGEGASGKTYLAIRRKDNRRVAIKVLKMDSTYKGMELFEREAKTLSEINVPGVPKFYGYVKSDETLGEAYLIQEYLPYPSLRQYLNNRKRFGEGRVYWIGQRLCDILMHLETEYTPPIIHRDIKPSNILYDENTGVCYLIDFGAVANPQRKSMGSTVAGTMGFMAPEQLLGDCTIQSDYYALGATMLNLLTGVSPADMEHDENDPFKIAYEKYLPRKISKEMRQILNKLLQPSVDDRPKNAFELQKIFNLSDFEQPDIIMIDDDTFKRLLIIGVSMTAGTLCFIFQTMYVVLLASIVIAGYEFIHLVNDIVNNGRYTKLTRAILFLISFLVFILSAADNDYLPLLVTSFIYVVLFRKAFKGGIDIIFAVYNLLFLIVYCFTIETAEGQVISSCLSVMMICIIAYSVKKSAYEEDSVMTDSNKSSSAYPAEEIQNKPLYIFGKTSDGKYKCYYENKKKEKIGYLLRKSDIHVYNGNNMTYFKNNAFVISDPYHIL